MKQIQNKPRNRLDKIRATVYDERDYEADGKSFLSRTVFEEGDSDDIDTGLLDASGNSIRRSRRKTTIGFVKF
jgi:hypothetical protein